MNIYLIPIFLSLLLFARLSFKHHRSSVILLTGLLPTYLLRLKLFNLPTNWLELAIIIVAVLGLLQPAIRQRWRIAWQQLPRPIIILAILFLLTCSISTLISPHLQTSLGILKSWVFIPLLLGWLVVGISDKYSAQSITITLILSGAAMAAASLLQLGALDRVRGIYDVPNSLALFLAPILILSIFGWRVAPWKGFRPEEAPLGGVPQGRNGATVTGPAILLTTIIIAVALIATQSAAAIAAVTISLLIGLHKLPSRKVKLALLSFIIIAIGYFSLTGRLTYLARPFDSPKAHNSISVRLQLWSVSWDLIKKHPVFGIGLGTFEPAYQQQLHQRFALETNNTPLPEFVFRDPHNWPLSFWLNTGLLGLLSFIGLHIYIFWQAKSSLRPVALALLTLLIFGLADTVYWKNDLAALHWILLGILASFTPGSKQSKTK